MCKLLISQFWFQQFPYHKVFLSYFFSKGFKKNNCTSTSIVDMNLMLENVFCYEKYFAYHHHMWSIFNVSVYMCITSVSLSRCMCIIMCVFLFRGKGKVLTWTSIVSKAIWCKMGFLCKQLLYANQFFKCKRLSCANYFLICKPIFQYKQFLISCV
jgi:hypothetical protein